MRLPSAGFTLVELLSVVAVTAIALGLASPGFGALRDEWALRVAANAVLGGLAEARLGALSAQNEGRLCPTQDGVQCAARGAGFLVATERILRTSALPAAVELSANRAAATYYPWPRAASPVTLTLCAVRERMRSRRVIVSQTGRPRVERAGAC